MYFEANNGFPECKDIILYMFHKNDIAICRRKALLSTSLW